LEIKEASAYADPRKGDLPGGKEQIPDLVEEFKSYFKGNLIINDGFNYDSGLQKI